MLILRKKEKMDLDTGIWVCIPDEHVLEMKKQFPMLKGVTFFEDENSVWQVLREKEEDFEELGLQFCSMIKKKHPWMGRVPKTKKRKSLKES